MIVGCTKELKNNEYRVGLTPKNVRQYIAHGHIVLMEKNAGLAAGFDDNEYIKSGAKIIKCAKDIYAKSDMIIKVKEPEPSEWCLLKNNSILFTYLHLAANPKLTKILLEKSITSIAYETIQDKNSTLPCLVPMSQIAGKMAIFQGANYLQQKYKGRGILLGGISDVEKGTVVIIGCGNVGKCAAITAAALGANIIALDKNENKLSDLKNELKKSVKCLNLTRKNLISSLKKADLVICSVLIPGGSTPKIITRRDLSIMKKGTVIVDVAIDQGGCCETSKPTSHDNPVYEVDGIIHYCVGNIPGAVPHTSTLALTNSTIKYGLKIADKGIKNLEKVNKSILSGINTYEGLCINKNVAKAYFKNNL